MGCGREENGKNAGLLGVCPATTETLLNGMHGGVNAGRSCWVVAGTFCNGEVQGHFARKIPNCTVGAFYCRVKSEEQSDFETIVTLLEKLKVHSITFDGKPFYYDQHGDLINTEDWSREFAEYVVNRNRLPTADNSEP